MDGDYRSPPPKDAHQNELEYSKKKMACGAVFLSPAARELACRRMGETLLKWEVEVIDLCVTGTHYHVLARFENSENPRTSVRGIQKDWARHFMGLAKKEAALSLRYGGLLEGTGAVWAKRCGVKPIADRKHQLNVVKYIRDHIHQGAAVWSMLNDQ